MVRINIRKTRDKVLKNVRYKYSRGNSDSGTIFYLRNKKELLEMIKNEIEFFIKGFKEGAELTILMSMDESRRRIVRNALYPKNKKNGTTRNKM